MASAREPLAAGAQPLASAGDGVLPSFMVRCSHCGAPLDAEGRARMSVAEAGARGGRNGRGPAKARTGKAMQRILAGGRAARLRRWQAKRTEARQQAARRYTQTHAG